MREEGNRWWKTVLIPGPVVEDGCVTARAGGGRLLLPGPVVEDCYCPGRWWKTVLLPGPVVEDCVSERAGGGRLC